MLSRVIAKNVGDVFFWDTVYKFYLGAFRIKLKSADSIKSSEIEPSSPRDADAVQNKLRFKVNLQ